MKEKPVSDWTFQNNSYICVVLLHACLTFIDVVVADGPLLGCMAVDRWPGAFGVNKHTLFLRITAIIYKSIWFKFHRGPIWPLKWPTAYLEKEPLKIHNDNNWEQKFKLTVSNCSQLLLLSQKLCTSCLERPIHSEKPSLWAISAMLSLVVLSLMLARWPPLLPHSCSAWYQSIFFATRR